MTMDLHDLVEQFAASVVGQSEAMATGDVNTGNQHALQCSEAFRALRSHGDRGRKALMVLLDHEHADVRVTAAAFLLRYCHERARAVLEKEAAGRGLVAFGAGQALQRWEDGDWQLDPDPAQKESD
jgi:hypothetical protein